MKFIFNNKFFTKNQDLFFHLMQCKKKRQKMFTLIFLIRDIIFVIPLSFFLQTYYDIYFFHTLFLYSFFLQVILYTYVFAFSLKTSLLFS